MKVTIDIECTPSEAREFIGLPDVQPMQEAIMKQLQDQLMANIASVSPEALMKTWFDPTMATQLQNLLMGMTGLGTTATTKSKK